MKQTINILIIEDSLSDAFLIGEYLEMCETYEYQTFHSEYLSEGLERIKTDDIDLVLIDLHLPDSNGANGLEKIFKKYSNTPFIVLTGLSDKSVAISLLIKGAKDYLVKGEIDANLLERSILYTIERKRLEEKYVTEILQAQDKEKERIARDVHDSLGQNLTSAVLQLENLKSTIKTDSSEVFDSVNIALKCLNEAITESRGISRSLMPQTVQRFGLYSGIESILHTLGEKSSVNFSINCDIEELRFPEIIEVTYFRIAQETINNVLKYSKAINCVINLVYENGKLIMVIRDNGIGFDPEYIENLKGIGLNSIKTRAKSIAGDLTISSTEGEGTEIAVNVTTEPKPILKKLDYEFN